MLALRYVYLLALVIWLGGMIVLGGLVAPITFDVLKRSDPEGGRLLAASVFGAAFRRFHLWAYMSGAAMLVALIGRALVGPRPVNFGIRLSLVAVMLAVSLFSGTWLTSRIEQVQRDIGPQSVSALPAGDPRQARFNFLHGVSFALGVAIAVGGLVLLLWEAKEQGFVGWGPGLPPIPGP